MDRVSGRRALFPAQALPAEPGDQKLIGLYKQAQGGLWLQRVKIPGGRLSARQWRALAAVAREFTPQTPLHLTTRQDVEIHDLTEVGIPPVQRALQEAQLTSFGAAGDTYRNITVCPCGDMHADKPDLTALQEAIEEALTGFDGIYNLPRKFKISLSCRPSCGQPWINDLSFVLSTRDGEWGLQAVGSGSLGARPGTGILLYDWLCWKDALPMALAAVDVFFRHGNRVNRRKARLRHLRERIGDEPFKALIDESFKTIKADRAEDGSEIVFPQRSLPHQSVLTFANGDVQPQAAEALADLADDDALAVRIANQHRVVLFAQSPEKLTEAISRSVALADAAALKTSVVACPGKRWCHLGLVHTNPLADRIRAELGDLLPAEATVCISGCPNGCAHPAVADFGLSGCLASEGDERREAFNLLVGGGMGRDDRLAQPLGARLSPDEVVETIRQHLQEAEVRT
ncbi:MAG: hypothetical protein ACYS8X_10460 [Planctomycetota bacterium]|jgi:sulfite reductase (ferredoxin)